MSVSTPAYPPPPRAKQRVKRRSPWQRLYRGASWVLVLFFVSVPAARWTAASWTPTIRVAVGQLPDRFEGESWFLRPGPVIVAPVAGRLRHLVKEGTWVEGRAPFARIARPDGDVTVPSPQSGIASWTFTGLEALLRDPRRAPTPEQMRNPDVPPEPRDGILVQAGQPIGRLASPWQGQWAVLTPTDVAVRLKVGQTAAVVAPGPDAPEVPVRIRSIGLPQGGESVVILTTDQLGKTATWPAHGTLQVIWRRFHGAVLPSRTLLQTTDRVGAFVLDTQGKLRFKALTVLYDNGQQAVVSGLVDGDRVALWPGVLGWLLGRGSTDVRP